MRRYPPDRLWEEMTYLAYHLHWDLSELLDLDHPTRNRLIGLVGDLERRRKAS